MQDELSFIVEDAKACELFPIGVHTKIYINKALKGQKNIPDIMSNRFDLASVEEEIEDHLFALVEKLNVDIISRTVFVRTANGRTTKKTTNVEDFGLDATDRVLEMIDATREQFPRSKVAITVEIRVSLPSPPLNKHSSKRKLLTSSPAAESPPGSSPPPAPASRKLDSHLSKKQRDKGLPRPANGLCRQFRITISREMGV